MNKTVMTIMENKLNSAKESRNDVVNTEAQDITKFIWKGQKEDVEGVRYQGEIRIVDASDEQLSIFYKHCQSMLYNTDSNNPGRTVLIKMIQEDREKCNAELYMRYLDGTYLPDEKRARYPRFMYLSDLNKYLSRNTDKYAPGSYDKIEISEFTEGIPVEFSNLKISMVKDACEGVLGKIHKKPITLTFLTRMGIWLSPDEMRDLTEKDPKTGKVRDRMEVIRERLGLKQTIRLHVNETGLTYKEFMSIVTLKEQTFNNLTTNQLIILREKILFRVENMISYQIDFWMNKMRELELVANSHGWSFEKED